MSLFSRNKLNAQHIKWLNLTSEVELDNFLVESEQKPVVFFKHSTRCSISSMAKNRLENSWDLDDQFVMVYLDLIAHRNLSNLLAEKLNVQHESPQLILVKGGKCVYNASHYDIRTETLKNYIA